MRLGYYREILSRKLVKKKVKSDIQRISQKMEARRSGKLSFCLLSSYDRFWGLSFGIFLEFWVLEFSFHCPLVKDYRSYYITWCEPLDQTGTVGSLHHRRSFIDRLGCEILSYRPSSGTDCRTSKTVICKKSVLIRHSLKSW